MMFNGEEIITINIYAFKGLSFSFSFSFIFLFQFFFVCNHYVCLFGERRFASTFFFYICIFKDIIYIVKVLRLILLLCVVYIISLIHLYMYMHQMKPKCSFFKMTVTVNSYVQTNMYFKDRIQVRGFNTYRPCFNQ